jgi:hypothetical protein
MEFSVYLVGTFERRKVGTVNVGTIFQIVNPTVTTLYVVAAAFDSDGAFQRLWRRPELKPNSLWELDLAVHIIRLTDHGVMKFFSLDVHTKELVPGIVGFQRRVLHVPEKSEATFSESDLVAVPLEFAGPDFEDHVRPHM